MVATEGYRIVSINMASAPQDLLDLIQWPCVEAVNAKQDHGIQNALKQVLATDFCTVSGVGAKRMHWLQVMCSRSLLLVICRDTGMMTDCFWSPTRMKSSLFTSHSHKVVMLLDWEMRLISLVGRELGMIVTAHVTLPHSKTWFGAQPSS